MTHNVADDALGKIARQQNDLFRRIREGSVNPEIASRQLQDAIEGNFTIQQVPIWKVVKQRRYGGAVYIERLVHHSTDYKVEGLNISVGSDEYDITLVRLKSSELRQRGKNALEVCKRAQEMGLTLCWPEVTLHLCLQHKMEPGERFVVPLYGFSSTSKDPGQCAVYKAQKTPGADYKRDLVSGMSPEECGANEDVNWVFQLKKVWNSEK